MKQVINIVFLSIGFFISLCADGQRSAALTGKIIDAKTGMPLAGASIYIHDINKGTIADNTGTFKTISLTPGKYLVEVSHTGYKNIVETIPINASTEKDFALTQSVTENEVIIVTGVSSATRLRQSPQPVDVLRKDELVRLNSTNIINALTHIAGVNALTTGPAISKPFIRGLGYNRIVTINDGVRQEGQQWGDEHGVEIDDYSAQRIEVLKGPASLMYGSDALAGVINIQSLVPAPEGVIKVNALSEYQTNNRLRGFYGNVAGTKNGFSFNAYGSYKGASDYKNKYDGYVFNSKFYNQNFGAMTGYSGVWGHSYLNVTNFNQRIGIVEGDRDSATGKFIRALPGGVEGTANDDDFNKIKPLIPFQHIRHFKITTDNLFNIGRNKLELTAGFQHNQRQEFGDPDNPTIAAAFFDLKTINYSARFTLPFTGNWKTTLGVTGMAQTNENKGEEALIPDYSLFDAGAFLFTQYHKNKVTLSGGVRLDNRHVEGKQMLDGSDIKFAAFTKDFSNISGSAGFSYEATTDVTLKLNIARGFRAPALAELASNGAHEGTNRYEIGDNNLKSETSFQIDGGVDINSEHVSLGVSAFYNNITNFIFYKNVLNNAGHDSILVYPVTGGEFHVFNFIQQNAHLYGLEFKMDIHPHPLDWLHFENTFSFTRAQFNNAIGGSKNVPFIPAARYISELRGNFLREGKSFRNLYVSVESDYTFKQTYPFTGFDTETATGDYWLVNAAIGTDIMSKGKTIFSVHVTGMNLGDVAYQNHLSRLKYTGINNVTSRQGVFNMGRNFGFKVNVPLDFKWN
ncbi:MAG: TonB-dependent receptor [Ginsengibacter sp.]